MAKRILALATTFPRWKKDTEPGFVFDLCKQLTKNNYDITVLAPHFKGAKKRESMSKVDVRRYQYFVPAGLQKLCYNGGILENIKRYPLSILQAPFLFCEQLYQAFKVVKEKNIQLIHAHWIVPQGIIAALVGKTKKIPYVLTAHAGDIFPLKNPMLSWMARWAIKDAKAVTVNSTYTKEQVLKIAPQTKVAIIPMGVDLSAYAAKNKSKTLKKKLKIKGTMLLFVGRLAQKKGVIYLINAMKRLDKKHKDAHLVIVGDGPQKHKIVQKIKEHKLQKKVTMIGKLPPSELPTYYATADIFVGPSIITKSGDTEGLGVVFLEALASKTPAIGSDVGGIPDIIIDRKTGLLVEQKNSLDLAAAIITLMEKPKLRTQLAKQGYNHVKVRFSWNHVADKFTLLLEN